MNQLRGRGEQFWGALSRLQRIIATVFAVAAISGAFLFATWARTPDYAVAFSNIGDEDAGAVVNKLKELKVPYEVGEGTIKVPASQVHEVRLQLASAGLPSRGGVGFELFNQSTFGMTEFIQKVNYQRALEGELSRTISRLEPVDQARVHIVIPQPSLFTEQQKAPTASVLVKLKPGRRLDSGQVVGIGHLVAGSIEGLKTENVTVLDTNGNVLTDQRAAAARSTGSSATTQSEAQKGFEASLQQKLQAMLDQVLGPGKSVVRVATELNWDQFEQTSETYSPNDLRPQPRSSREVTEKVSGTQQANVGGVPGTDTNIPSYQGAAGGAGRGDSERRETTNNYELSKLVEKSVKAPGGIKRLSVAVVLDQEATPELAERISQVISAAAGIDAKRGDQVIVSGLPFDRSVTQQQFDELETAKRTELIADSVRSAAVIIGPVLALLVLWRLIGRRSLASPIPALPAAAPQTSLARAAQPAALAEPVIDSAVVAEHREKARVRTEIVSLAKTNPVTLAQLIQTWLEEDARG